MFPDRFTIGFLVFFFFLLITGTLIPILFCVLLAFIAWFLFEVLTGDHSVPNGNKGLVLVTGCSSGIGRSAAIHLAKKGLIVYAGVRKKEDGESLKKEHPQIIPIVLDITNPEHVSNAALEVEKKIMSDRLTFVGLVNNAGFLQPYPIEIEPMESIKKTYEVNFFGQIAVTKAFLPLLRKYQSKKIGGRIVFVSSIGAYFTAKCCTTYGSSKGALEAMAKTLKEEVGSWNIKVVLIEPGAIVTDIYKNSHSLPQADYKHVESSVLDHHTSTLKAASKTYTFASKISSTTKDTDWAIYKGLLTKYPRTHYFIGRAAGIANLTSKLPESIVDFVSKIQ